MVSIITKKLPNEVDIIEKETNLFFEKSAVYQSVQILDDIKRNKMFLSSCNFKFTHVSENIEKQDAYDY